VRRRSTPSTSLIPKLNRLYLSKELDSLQPHIRAAVERISTKTGEHFARHQELKTEPRAPDGAIQVRSATTHNLHNVDVDIPRGVLTVGTGVAGSGKSSLIRGHVRRVEPEATLVDQRIGSGSRRSNAATYTEKPVRSRSSTGSSTAERP
jgi:excinuclease UvrABC ATPase subunit